MMNSFKLVAPYNMSGDQPEAVAKLTAGLNQGARNQVLLGVTGSGKTFTMANIVARVNRPSLVIAHNKTLAAQLYSEFKEFFPKNAVEYFVSYYDYYQPEAYIPQTDTYIEKDASINQEIDRLRHAATSALFERRDVLIVASVSCIYGLGSPEDYKGLTVTLRRGEWQERDKFLRRLVGIQYSRNDLGFSRGTFRVRGDVVEIIPAYEENIIRIQLFGDEVERILEIDPLTGELLGEKEAVTIYPATHYITTEEKMKRAIAAIEEELEEQLARFRADDKLLEDLRLEQRTRFDLVMLREVGYCQGFENDSRHLTGRGREAPPPSWIISPMISWFLSTNPMSLSRSCGRCMPETAPARRPWSVTASGCRRPWITAPAF